MIRSTHCFPVNGRTHFSIILCFPPWKGRDTCYKQRCIACSTSWSNKYRIFLIMQAHPKKVCTKLLSFSLSFYLFWQFLRKIEDKFLSYFPFFPLSWMKKAFRVVHLCSPAAPSGPLLGARQSPISQRKKKKKKSTQHVSVHTEEWASVAYQSGFSNSEAMHFEKKKKLSLSVAGTCLTTNQLFQMPPRPIKTGLSTILELF